MNALNLRAILVSAFALTATLVACSGGSATMPASPATTQPITKTPQGVTITVTIPTKSSSARRPDYISAGTTKMQIGITPGPSVSPPNPLSTTVPCSGSTCTATIGVYPGQNTFVVNLLDSASPADTLSTATATQTIGAGANTVNLTFLGVPIAVAFAPGTTSFISGTSGTQVLTPTVLDASGNTITGTFSTPIPLAVSPTGYVTLSQSSLTSSTQTVTATYAGAAAPCSLGGGIVVLATNAFGVQGPASAIGVFANGCVYLTPPSLQLPAGTTQTETVYEPGFSGTFSISSNACTGNATVTPVSATGPTATFNIQATLSTGFAPCIVTFSDGTNTATLPITVM